MRYQASDLSAYIRTIRNTDPDVFGEIDKLIKKKARPDWLSGAAKALADISWEGAAVEEGIRAATPGYGVMEPESIALRFGRPVLAIQGNAITLSFADADSETWRARLTASSKQIVRAIPSVGRIEVRNHPSGFEYMGTGWVIDTGIIATNRHVALAFAERGWDGFRFLTGFDRKNPVGVDIDFLEEIGSSAQREFAIKRVIYIARDDEPDIAFLALESNTGVPALSLLSETIPLKTMVAAIGYPAKDTRLPDQGLMERIFGGVYEKKRLAPGFAGPGEQGLLAHDCTTLGGNSGSPLIDLATGKVCGLHFSGAFLKANYAVPAHVVGSVLRRVKNGEATAPITNVTSGSSEQGDAQSQCVTPSQQGQEVRIILPIELSIRLGQAQLGPGSVAALTVGNLPAGKRGTPSAADIEAAVAEARRLFASRRDVVAIRSGWMFSDGWITDTRSVVVSVRSKLPEEELEARGMRSLPTEILGVPLDVRPASLEDLTPEGVQLEAYSRIWNSPYEKWPEVPLDAVDEDMTVTLHASPDAGWPVLSEFLGKTKKRLTIGMYDFTAPHIVEAVDEAGKRRPRTISLVLQRGEDVGKGSKKDDLTDEQTANQLEDNLSDRFSFAWASVYGANALFRSAYHIKVAVRDGKAFWLSSGNWQSSNQPPFDPLSGEDTSPSLLTSRNREWHTVVEHEGLADIFEKYLIRDRTQAQDRAEEEALAAPEQMVWVPEAYFQPTEAELEAPPRYFRPLTISRQLRVQPLLTPDNYSEHVVRLINSAKKKLYFQNQSLKVGPRGEHPDHYERLLEALLAKQQAGLDVRIIIRKIGDVRGTVEAIRNYGFDTNSIRLQTNCHTKGIIVDSQAVLLGSQNWTGDGTGYNRDASLIIFDEEAAKYFEQLFLYDWNRVGRPRIDESLPPPELATGEETFPKPGMALMPLSRWLGEA